MKIIDESLNSTFTIMSLWSLESDGEFEITGNLEYDDGDIKLTLLNTDFSIEDKFNEIYGKDSKGNCIILKEIFVKQQVEGSINSCILIANKMFVGKSFFEEIKVSEVTFSANEYSEWINKNIITFKDGFVKLSRENIKSDEIKLSNNVNVYDYLKGKERVNRNSVNLTQEKCFKIKFINMVDFEDAFEITNRFKNLTAIIMKKPINFLWVDLRICEYKFRMFYSQNNAKSTNKIKGISYSEIDNLEDIYRNWFNLKDDLKVLENVIVLNETLPTYLNTKLIDAIKALEVYHRNFMDQGEHVELPSTIEEDRIKLMQFIEDNIIAEEYFLGKVMHEEQGYNLNSRLVKIFTSLPQNLKEKYIKKSNKKMSKSISSLAYILTETRNNYVHADDMTRYPKSLKDSDEISDMIEKLKDIIWYLYLKTIGIEETILIDKLIPKQYKFEYPDLEQFKLK